MEYLSIKNFRDIKGYVTREGLVMKPNMIYRGSPLCGLKDKEKVFLEQELNIKHIIDFRDEQEAMMMPDCCFENITYKRIGALIGSTMQQGFDFGKLLQGKMTKNKLYTLLNYIEDGYKHMAFNNPAYHHLFAELLKNDGGIYFHCSAGKDRTGVAAFLIMMALDINEDDAVSEYLLSNDYLKESNDHLCEQLHIPISLKKECEPLLYVQKEFIDLTIQSIKNRYQSYDEFFFQEYRLDRQTREKLKKIYCE